MGRLRFIKRYRVIEGVFIMAVTLFSSYSAAKGPDFENPTKHTFDLSSTQVSIQLPGKLDNEFPVEAALYRVNIFDNGEYQESGYYKSSLIRRHWDYRGFFWQGLSGQFALMEMFMTLNKAPKDTSIDLLKDIAPLQGVVSSDIQRKYDDLNKKNAEDSSTADVKLEAELKFEKSNFNGIKVLKCNKKDNHPFGGRKEYTNFYVPISEQHYISIYFKLIPVGDKDKSREKWYPQSQKDIQRIMESLTVKYPAS